MAYKQAQGITLQLSKRKVARVCIAAIGLAFVATLGSWTLVHGVFTVEEIERLRGENEALLQAREYLVSRLWELQVELIRYENRTQELAVVAGLELDDEMRLGLGGEDPEAVRATERLTDLSSRSLRLSQLLDDVEMRLAGTPSVLPARGQLTSRFGYRTDPLTGERSFHRGIDIGTDADRAVYASASGVVSLAGRKGALGNAVRLSHGDGLATRYGHLSRIAVEAGQEVEQGDVLGYVGRTGRATGFHLHYEILLDGRPVDPLRYVKSNLEGR